MVGVCRYLGEKEGLFSVTCVLLTRLGHFLDRLRPGAKKELLSRVSVSLE
jgi:hypothetical protein